MDKIDFYANEFNESNWIKFSNCFKKYYDSTNCFVEIPEDIVNVLTGLLGVEESKDWINRELSQLDLITAIELIKTEKGIKALKSFIMRMPN